MGTSKCRWNTEKTGKSALGKHLENDIANVDFPSGLRATIVDAMAVVQIVHGENLTFEEVSDTVPNKVLSDGRGSSRIDVVFDIYQEKSIQTAEPEQAERGSKPGIVFSQIQPGHQIKNWKNILASNETKAKLTKFIAENWKELRQTEKLHDVILMVTSGERCFRLTIDDVTEITELRSMREKTDDPCETRSSELPECCSDF